MAELDKLDIKIARELIQDQSHLFLSDFRRSLRIIGKKFKVDEHTVKNRMARLRRLGLLEDGWWLFLSPNLLGLKLYVFWLDIPAHSKDDLIRKLKLTEGVINMNHYYSNVVHALIFSRDEESLRKKIELISTKTIAENAIVGEAPYPACQISLTRTDWQIIRSMLTNPKKSYDVVGKDLRLSTKTVKRRLRRMTDGKALFAIISSSLRLFTGGVVADLVVLYVNSESRSDVDKKILSRLDDYLVFVAQLIGVGFFRVIIPNLPKADEILSWVNEQSGVRSARIELLLERIQQYGALNEQVERKLEEIGVPTH